MATTDRYGGPGRSGEPVMTPEEATALATVFADDLAHGWIPRPRDLEDALAALRAV